MGISVCYCQDHQAFLSLAITYVAKTCFFLFLIGSPAEPASMASRCHFLAMFMHTDGTFWTLDDGIRQFWEIAEAGRAGSSYDMLRTFVVFWFLPAHVSLEGDHIQNGRKLCLHEAIILIGLDAFVVVERVYSFLAASSFQIFYNQSAHVVIMKLGVLFPKMIVSEHVFPCECWAYFGHYFLF
jgi:hypothetical protein